MAVEICSTIGTSADCFKSHLELYDTIKFEKYVN